MFFVHVTKISNSAFTNKSVNVQKLRVKSSQIILFSLSMEETDVNELMKTISIYISEDKHTDNRD